ncbi:hypothetical protein B9Z55_001218 [Caenorhabditis nigoni]|uniref:glucuronosyltransferase n=2 Tax=Caenorhabditis nigoni TaxID=1611254 RepID=A0A2G5VES1_9PELO|nr:hypothetical protein B9Z55_001218 [Caenorhabditis nigoni]
MSTKLFLIFSSFFLSVNSVNVLVYSPAFAASHTNFMARLADTLTESGHNVTFLVPIIDVARRNQLGVRLTTDVVVVEQDDKASQEHIPFDESMEAYWTMETDSSNVEDSIKWFFDGMKVGCENFLRDRNVFELMKSRNFDVAILEPLSVCGLGFFEKLGIEKTILASSCANYDYLFRHLGEPNEYSYVPSLMSTKGEKMNFFERFENYKVSEGMSRGISRMFDAEQKTYQKYLGENLPDWRDLLPAASLFFTNSNPYLDFPRPVLQKTVPIGGISVDMKKIRSHELNEEWNFVLNQRKHNILISFGSLVQSSHMHTEARDNILKVIRSEPNVTFIWKYETNETSFANGIPNIHFSKWVPQPNLLGDPRISAFLTHGGLGSTNELAHCGKPAIVVPIFGDQHRNAYMLERHGGAIVVQKTELHEWKTLKSAVTKILYDGKYKKNAIHLADLLLNQPLKPKDLVTKYVEFVAKYGPFPEMDPYGRKLNFFQRHLLDVWLMEILGHLALFLIIFWVIPFRLRKMTYLMPVVDVEKRDECIGVKLTKDLIIVEMFKWFSSDMKIACRNFLSRRDIFNQMKSRNFDLAILEPVSVCGLGFVKALGIEKIILASSCTFFDTVLPYIGEPLDFSYVPAGFSVTGDVMSISERYENWLVTKEINAAFEDMHDGETELYKEFLGENIPDWRDLLPTASIFFVNSNPFLDFPRPVLQKTIPIGGISVNMKWTTEHQISSEWEQILNKRTSNVLISFGSMVKSTHMPLKWRNGLLETIKSMSNVTFIWKYESENVSFADGINNLHFSKWVPQITLLSDPRLTAFVSHGGLGSTMELAYSEKPAVVIPVFADQIRNANMLARHKGAIYLHKNHMENVEIVRKAFEDVLFDESYKRNAVKLADILNNQPYSPKENVIKYTEFVGEHGPFPSMDPYGRHHNYFQKTFLDIYAIFALYYLALVIFTLVAARIIYVQIRNCVESKLIKRD